MKINLTSTRKNIEKMMEVFKEVDSINPVANIGFYSRGDEINAYLIFVEGSNEQHCEYDRECDWKIDITEQAKKYMLLGKPSEKSDFLIDFTNETHNKILEYTMSI